MILSIGGVYGQHNSCRGDSIDSVLVRFASLGKNHVDIALMSDKWTLSFLQKVYNPYRQDIDTLLIYQTHNYDTIDYVFNLIRIIISNQPFADSLYVSDCDGMIISVFENNTICEYMYHHFLWSYFPFAYTELYCLIRQVLTKYGEKDVK